MNPLLIGPLADLIRSVIGKIWPDPAAQAEAQLKLAEMVQSGELAKLAAATDLAKAQIGVNNTEAAASSLFVAGARPYVMWVCGTAMAYNFILAPLLSGLAAFYGSAVALPTLDISKLMPVLLGMLGLGGM